MIVNDSGGVIEQLANTYMMALQGKFRDKLRNVVVQRQLAFLRQLQNGDAGEGKHRPDDVIHSFIFGRGLQAEIGEAVTFMKNDLSSTRHQHRSAHHPLARNGLPSHLVEIGRTLGKAKCRCGDQKYCKSSNVHSAGLYKQSAHELP